MNETDYNDLLPEEQLNSETALQTEANPDLTPPSEPSVSWLMY